MERYIKEVLGEDKRQAVDYHDYLKMAEELGYNMRESWILFPKNLEQRHEELIEESREREIKAKEDLDNKKDKKYEKYRKRDSYLEMETEQFVLRLPKRIHEIRQEGNDANSTPTFSQGNLSNPELTWGMAARLSPFRW